MWEGDGEGLYGSGGGVVLGGAGLGCGEGVGGGSCVGEGYRLISTHDNV